MNKHIKAHADLLKRNSEFESAINKVVSDMIRTMAKTYQESLPEYKDRIEVEADMKELIEGK